MTRETVFFDTFARRAMSLMVALRPTILSDAFASGALASGISVWDPFALDVLVLGMRLQFTWACHWTKAAGPL
jgi:hypothetical protein